MSESPAENTRTSLSILPEYQLQDSGTGGTRPLQLQSDKGPGVNELSEEYCRHIHRVAGNRALQGLP